MKTTKLIKTALLLLLAVAPLCLLGQLHLQINRVGSNMQITWTNNNVALETSQTLDGDWNEVTGAVSPLISPSNAARFFRLRGTVTPRDFGFRYVAPEFTAAIGVASGCGCTSPENRLATGGSEQDNGGGAVLLYTGELTQDVVDLVIPGRGFDWRFERHYRSGMNYGGPIGEGWDFNYNRRLEVETNGHVLCVNGLGRVDRYTLNTNGTFDSPSGFYTRLTRKLDGTFEERERHGMTNSYAATNNLGIAKLTRISDRNGNMMTFQYNSGGQLTNVVDTLAHSIAYRYDSNGRLTNVTDFTGRVLRFTYDVSGNLVSATSPVVTGTPNTNDFPSGKMTLYTYASSADARFDHNLLSVTAPNEVTVSGPARLVAQYNTNPLSPHADRLVSLRLGGTNTSGVGAGGTISYNYANFGPAGTNDFATAVFQNRVTNRNGNVIEYRFNQLGNLVRRIQFTRGLRPGDPPGYTNTFAYNRDGEMIARTNAELDSAEFTFDSANPDRFQQGNLRQVRRLPGPRSADQAQIVIGKTYEPNFNFVATATDARGYTTTNRYDLRGNCTNTVHRLPSSVKDREFNSFGQLTAHVWPANGSGHRRRDAFTYYGSGPQTGYRQTQIIDVGGFAMTTTFEYNSRGFLIRQIDPRGNDRQLVRNQLDQVVRRASRAVQTDTGSVRYETDYVYDSNDNLVRQDVQNRDEQGTLQPNEYLSTSFDYDMLNQTIRVSRERDTNHNVTVEFSRDANGNQTLIRKGEAVNGKDTNNVVQRIFDERNRLSLTVRAPGGALQGTTQFDYGGDGNLVRVAAGLENNPRFTTNVFDGFNRRVSRRDAMGNVSRSHFDANGNLTNRVTSGEIVDQPGGASNVRLAEVTFAYDALNRRTRTERAFFDPRTQQTIGDGLAVSQFAYSDTSQVKSILNDNGHGVFTAYDTAGRIAQIRDSAANQIDLEYDPNSNLRHRTSTEKSSSGGADEVFQTSYTYDALDRTVAVVEATPTGSRTTRAPSPRAPVTPMARNNAASSMAWAG